MNIYKTVASFAIVVLLCLSCTKEELDCCAMPPGEEESSDPRLEFVGMYDCEKSNSSNFQFSQKIEVLVEIDSANVDNISINGVLVPMDDSGVYGPDYINPSTNYFVAFRGDSLVVENFGSIPNGIVLPCYIKGIKRG